MTTAVKEKKSSPNLSKLFGGEVLETSVTHHGWFSGISSPEPYLSWPQNLCHSKPILPPWVKKKILSQVCYTGAGKLYFAAADIFNYNFSLKRKQYDNYCY